MSSKLDSEREKRLAKTGKWFQGSSRDNNKDIFLLTKFTRVDPNPPVIECSSMTNIFSYRAHKFSTARSGKGFTVWQSETPTLIFSFSSD